MAKMEELNTEMAEEINAAEVVLLEAKENKLYHVAQTQLTLDEATENLELLE